MARGTLRIFLGSAPGAGKTYAMLREAHRLRDGGEDVVVAFARDRGRRDTRALLAGLELVPAKRVPYQGLQLEELDLDAVIRRGPATAIVDDYAHANPPGSPNSSQFFIPAVRVGRGADGSAGGRLRVVMFSFLHGAVPDYGAPHSSHLRN